MLMVLNKILNVAKYDCNVLITGDTGVGKEKVAALIHKNCSRRMHPFIKVNCAAVSAHLLESEFFGYEKGAFTGASSSGKVGYIEAADNGVLFLDEIGELPFELQAKLLRVLQEGEFMRVGGTKSVQTNVRIISATNKNPDALVAEKIFRADLYYRLNVFPIRVPNLSERREEVPVLTKHFLAKYNVKFGSDKAMSDEAIRFLGKRNWAGNIRELENFVQRLIINVKNNRIELMDVIAASNSELALDTPNIGELRGEDAGVSGEPRLTDLVNLYESEIIKYALSKYGTTRKAAAALGVSQSQLMRKKNKSRQT
jgi:transcriptional regulator with PAS, ATPase and Fis domain